jgi:hypothetical protein
MTKQKQIPRLGQILLVTIMSSYKHQVIFRYLTLVLQVQIDYREKKRIAITRIIAVEGHPSDIHVDELHEVKVNELRAKNHKVELVGLTYLPRCLSWNLGTTYERILKREPLEEIERCDNCYNIFEKKELRPIKNKRVCPRCLEYIS